MYAKKLVQKEILVERAARNKDCCAVQTLVRHPTLLSILHTRSIHCTQPLMLRVPSVWVAFALSLSLSLFLLQQAALTLMEQHFAINALHTHAGARARPSGQQNGTWTGTGGLTLTDGRTAGLRNRRTHLYTTRTKASKYLSEQSYMRAVNKIGIVG